MRVGTARADAAVAADVLLTVAGTVPFARPGDTLGRTDGDVDSGIRTAGGTLNGSVTTLPSCPRMQIAPDNGRAIVYNDYLSTVMMTPEAPTTVPTTKAMIQ